jgi:hypothetical protein
MSRLSFPLRSSSSFFPKEAWTSISSKTSNLFLHHAPQGSEAWKIARKGYVSPKALGWNNIDTLCVPIRITASKFNVCRGLSPFQTAQEYAEELLGLKEPKFTPQQRKNMAHGTKMEPFVRQHYEQLDRVHVEEWGLVVPEWNPHLGASVDGLVLPYPPSTLKGFQDQWSLADGLLEIKCPQNMYKPLTQHYAALESGWEPRPYHRTHIYESHYDQMQGCMAILEKEWCDYVVYCSKKKLMYRERIEFNPNYWNNVLYPSLQDFIEHILYPLARETYG